MKKFDPTKPVQTREGRPARIICTDVKYSKFPIMALVDYGNCEMVHRYTTTGDYWADRTEDPDDLVNIPPKEVSQFYCNVYNSGFGAPCNT